MWRLGKHRTLVTHVTKHVTLLGSHVERKRCLAPSAGRIFTDRWRPSAVKWHRMKKCCECYLLLSARAWPPDIRGAEFCPCHAWGRYPEERLNTVKINACKAAYTQTFCYNLIKLRQQRASMVYSAFAQTYTFPFSNPTLEGVGHILCHITWCCWLDLSTFLLESCFCGSFLRVKYVQCYPVQQIWASDCITVLPDVITTESELEKFYRCYFILFSALVSFKLVGFQTEFVCYNRFYVLNVYF